jgi:hypothetical protein
LRPGCSLAAAAAAAAIVAGMAGASPAGQLPGRFPSLEPIAGAVSGYLKTQKTQGGVGGVAKSQGQCDNVIMLLGTALRLAEFVTRPTRMAAHRTSSSACASMPVLHEAALICKLAWPSWSVCNYLPTCLLVLLTCAVPRCMMLTLPSSDQRSPVATGSIANLTFISSMAVMAFVGQYGTDALAGAGLGFMWLNVSGQSIIFGTGMGLSALSSQAFGAKNYRRVALLVQRQLCYQMLLCAPIGLCWWNTERILTAFGQPPSVAYFSGQYCRHMLPGLPAIPVFNNLNAFLVSQRIPRPSMMVSLFSNLCVSVPTAFYLSQPHVLGFVGAPLGVASGQICQALLMRIVAPRVVRHPTWLPLQREALHPASWIELIRLGMGGAVGLWAEWWSNELM